MPGKHVAYSTVLSTVHQLTLVSIVVSVEVGKVRHAIGIRDGGLHSAPSEPRSNVGLAYIRFSAVTKGNPADATWAVPMLQRQRTLDGRVPRQASFDGGFAAQDNL